MELSRGVEADGGVAICRYRWGCGYASKLTMMRRPAFHFYQPKQWQK